MGTPADVYSFGMLLLELWAGELVYSGVHAHKVRCAIFLRLPSLCASSHSAVQACRCAAVHGCGCFEKACKEAFMVPVCVTLLPPGGGPVPGQLCAVFPPAGCTLQTTADVL